MLGKIYEKTVDGRISLSGHLATRDIAEDFRLVPCSRRQSDDSPTHDIMARSSIHGKEYCAGKAWQGKTMNGMPKFDLVLEIPGTALEGVKLTALEQTPGEYDVLPPKKKQVAVEATAQQQAA